MIQRCFYFLEGERTPLQYVYLGLTTCDMAKIYLNKLYLIGNGFDLNHNLPTSYEDFLIWYVSDMINRAYEEDTRQITDDCITLIIDSNYRNKNLCESTHRLLNRAIDSKDLTILLYDTQNSNNSPNKQLQFSIHPQNNFIKHILTECLSSEWGGIEDAIHRYIKACHYKVQKDHENVSINRFDSQVYREELKNIKSLNSSVAHLRAKLKEYLANHNAPAELNMPLFSSKMDWDYYYSVSEPDWHYTRKVMFLNFNYTTYHTSIMGEIEKDYNDESINFDSINIHGTVDSPLEDIVFGVGDEQNDFYSLIESLYCDEWLYCMKSFYYFRNKSYQRLLGFIKGGDYEINILGHSCSITDRTLLNMLFENKFCKKIHVFHYKGMDSYSETTYNIARNFKDKVKMREVVQPFDPKLVMNKISLSN